MYVCMCMCMSYLGSIVHAHLQGGDGEGQQHAGLVGRFLGDHLLDSVGVQEAPLEVLEQLLRVFVYHFFRGQPGSLARSLARALGRGGGGAPCCEG